MKGLMWASRAGTLRIRGMFAALGKWSCLLRSMFNSLGNVAGGHIIEEHHIEMGESPRLQSALEMVAEVRGF